MPQAIDLVINNAAAVAKTFVLIAPAAGDGAYANWRLKEGTVSSVFPRIAIKAMPTSNGVRKSNVKLQVPYSYTDSTTGLTKTGSSFDANIDVTVPDDFPESFRNDTVAYLKNLVAHAMVQAVMRDGYSAT